MLSSAQEAYLGRLRFQLTEARLTPYLKKARGDVDCALARYYWNIRLCKAFYPLLQELEIALRNNLDRAFAAAHHVTRYRDVVSWLDSTPVVVVHKEGQEDIARAKEN
ncbi:MAG TPA: hypothetical protein VFS44_13195 [Gemmatimonadaceae bacterium]|nr:hypothetical protein [Gemmatimonadaceae bacterium]